MAPLNSIGISIVAMHVPLNVPRAAIKCVALERAVKYTVQNPVKRAVQNPVRRDVLAKSCQT